MDGVPLRTLLPLSPDELAGAAAAVASQLADLHSRGAVHGRVSADTVVVLPGRVELTQPTGHGEPLEDVAALGRMVAAALHASATEHTAPTVASRDLAMVAADARRARLTGGPGAHELIAAFARAVPTARLPRVPTTERDDADDTRGMSRVVSAGLLTAWIALLAASVLALGGLGGDFAAPPLLDGRGAIDAWLDARDAPTVVFAVVRVVVLGLALYLLATTVGAIALRLASRMADGSRAARLADAILLPPVRRLVHGVIGAGIAIGAVATTTGAAADPAPIVIRRTPAVDDAVMRNLDGTDDAMPVMRMARASDNSHEDTRTITAVGTSAEQREWTIAPGDHLWAIAERVLSDAWRRAPTDAEVDPYWRQVIAANNDLFGDPANPDLVFPGQRFRVPPPPAPPADS